MNMSLIGEIFLNWRRSLQKRMLPTGCTLKQHYLLERLANRSYLTPSEIAEELYCDRPTASVVIKNLEKRGWVERLRDPENGRSFRIRLTDAGRGKLAETGDVLRDAGNPLDIFSKEELRILKTLLLKLRNSLE